MEIISNPTHDEIKKAAKALKDGHLVAFPTETVYGLGADATNEKAVSRIYSVKGRPTDHPLIVHISSINQLDKWAIDIPDYAVKLAKEFWPGPMTLILKRSKLPKDYITGGQENVGIRVPAHTVALKLLTEFEKIGGLGVVAPSANKYGAVSPTTSEAVSQEISTELNADDIILNGGSCNIGIESTIVSCINDSPELLRPGLVTIEQISKISKSKKIIKYNKSNVKHSGDNKSHYSPNAKVITNTNPKQGDGFIAMSNIITPPGVKRIASPNTTLEFAQVLYESLRLCDELKLHKVVIALPEGPGMAEAIRDRVIRAANDT